MRPAAHRADLLDHEPPTGRGLQPDLKLPTIEAAQEPRHRFAMRRRDPRPAHLAGLGSEPLRGDLPSMLVKSHYDRHKGPPQAPRFTDLRGSSALELRRSLLMPSFHGCGRLRRTQLTPARNDARASETRTGSRPLTHCETEARPRARVTLVVVRSRAL